MAQARRVDKDLIARLCPVTGYRDAATIIRNNPDRLRYVEYVKAECLELRFSHGPRKKFGFVFGTHPTCDIVLPQLTGLSSRHFAITFEDQRYGSGSRRLVLRDYSTNGTAVFFGGARVKTTNLRWLLDWQGIADTPPITIELLPSIRFRIVVNDQNLTSGFYTASVEHFLRGRASNEEMLTELHLQTCTATRLATNRGNQTTGVVLLQTKTLAHNPSARFKVSQFVDASSGASFAGKSIIQHSRERRTEERTQELKGLMELLRRMRHERIDKLLGWKPVPLGGYALFTEFRTYGNILEAADKRPLKRMEIVEVVKQAAEGLVYLHAERNVPHMNLKPSNILVKQRNPLSIMLADVGSRGNDDWLSNPHHCAPEVVSHLLDAGNTFPADIWSLGATAMHLTLGVLPAMESASTYPQHTLHPFLWSGPSGDPLETLLRPMLALNPADRPDAAKCLDDAKDTLQLMASTIHNTAAIDKRANTAAIDNTANAAAVKNTVIVIEEDSHGNEASEDREDKQDGDDANSHDRNAEGDGEDKNNGDNNGDNNGKNNRKNSGDNNEENNGEDNGQNNGENNGENSGNKNGEKNDAQPATAAAGPAKRLREGSNSVEPEVQDAKKQRRE